MRWKLLVYANNCSNILAHFWRTALHTKLCPLQLSHTPLVKPCQVQKKKVSKTNNECGVRRMPDLFCGSLHLQLYQIYLLFLCFSTFAQNNLVLCRYIQRP